MVEGKETTLETTFLQKTATLLQNILIFENQCYTLSLKKFILGVCFYD